ncbi:MAG: hypothetical protein WD314_06520 [Trueperaceae bacterium]
MERHNDISRNLIVTTLVAVLMAGFVLAYALLAPGRAQAQMGGMGMQTEGPVVPPVKGYAGGEEILFIHTEASDGEIADTLSEMMGSPVLLVPSLAEAPQAMRANVYVFDNGVVGDGPFGFQPDVFDNPPPSEGYSPLRAVNVVTWQDEGEARELRSADEVLAVEERGDVSIEQTGAVANMPILTWPGGQR